MSNRPDSKRFAVAAALVLVLLTFGAPDAFDQSTDRPVSTQETERVEVNLVILDTVVLDSRGNPVPDLTIDDFELVIDGKFVPVDTFDASCGHSMTEGDDPTLLTDAGTEAVDPKIVLAFDYLHLAPIERVEAIERMKAMVRSEGIDGYKLMVVALTGAVRVEQPLTDDREAVLASLDRMENDPTLAVPDFFHQNAFVFLRGLTGLFDLLGSKPGSKAVVLFSAMEDVPLEYQFEQIAAIAASSRCAIYPVDVRGLTVVEPVQRTAADVHREVREKLGVLFDNESKSVEESMSIISKDVASAAAAGSG